MSSSIAIVSSLLTKQFSASFHVQPKYFQLILEGKKTVEGRVAREKYLSLKAGDAIQFLTERCDRSLLNEPNGMISETLAANVISLKKFSSFSEMLIFYGLKNCLPGIESLSEGIKIYHGFPGYEADAKAFGAIGIEIALDKNHPTPNTP